jgi:AcrR family transcriptional regulator
VDGRTARAERTRRAIVDALLALAAEGDLKASPEQIVERAGVSLRTLWTQFKDLENLYAAASVRLIELQEAEHRPVDRSLPLTERVAAFCAQRGRMLEIVAPAARAAALRLPYSAQLRRNQSVHNERLQHEIEAVFHGELPARDPARRELVLALVINTGWPAWAMLRDDLGLEPADAIAIMRRTVAALVSKGQV